VYYEERGIRRIANEHSFRGLKLKYAIRTTQYVPPVPQNDQTIILATRGSALALAQANAVAAQCRAAFPRLRFELKIIKTTGDKLQTASLAQEGKTLPKGLFTKELEVTLM